MLILLIAVIAAVVCLKNKTMMPFGKPDPNALKAGEEIKAIEGAKPEEEKKEGDVDASGADLLKEGVKINS